MRFWKRQATLQIGGHRYSLDDLRFSFEVVSEDDAGLPICKLEVLNLAKSTRASITKNTQIILNAGYAGDVGSLFVGQVASCSHVTGDLDVTTKITAADSLELWLGTNINKSYKGPIFAQAILSDLLSIFGIEVALNMLAVNKEYKRGKVCTGKLKDVLTALVCTDCQSRLIIRTGQIIIAPPGMGVTTGYLLSPETGLLKNSTQTEEQQVNTTAKADKKTRAAQAEAEGKMTREALLNYHIGVGDVVAIRSAEGSGNYLVQKVTHKGSYAADWKTIMEVMPA
jgi:hypothetical protein